MVVRQGPGRPDDAAKFIPLHRQNCRAGKIASDVVPLGQGARETLLARKGRQSRLCFPHGSIAGQSLTAMSEQSRRQPMFNVPGAVVWLLVVMGLVHAIVSLTLTAEQKTEFLLLFAFIPARYDASIMPDVVWPGGVAADIWTFITYALIHGDITHLLFNSIWLLAFGPPVARRFGSVRFLLFMAVTAAAGAVVHLLTHYGELLPMIGASAAISGAMAAATRFAFQRGGPLGLWRDSEDAYRVPAADLFTSLRDKRVLAFLAVWFGVNLLFGAWAISMAGFEQTIAWQAHIGGFLAGLLGFSLFDPIGVAPRAGAKTGGTDAPS
jgi:membrane associated rhomboid family serine protease